MRKFSRINYRLGEQGTASIEFAMVGPLFILLLLAIFELGFMVYVQTVLDGAARDAARLVRTGQVQGNANPQSVFQNLLCQEVAALVGCGSLIFNVQTFGSFSTVNLTPPRDKNGNLITTFSGGKSGSDMAVQVIYNRPFFTSYVGKYLGGGSGSAFLTSTVIFRNEPF